MTKYHNYSVVGLISFAIGIFNILLSIVIYWALWSYIYHKYGEMLLLQSQILNIGSKVELFTKPFGLLLGAIAISQKNKNKLFSIMGIVINFVVILWTLAVFISWVI